MIKTKRIWVVEVLHTDFEHLGWQTTVGVGLNKEDGRREKLRWGARLPDDKVRLRCYIRKQP